MGAHVREKLSVRPTEKVGTSEEAGFRFDFANDPPNLMRQALDAWGQLDGRVHLVVAQSGEVLAAGESAKMMGQNCSGIVSIRSGKLQVADPDCQLRLEKFLQVRPDHEATLVLECRKGAEHCILRGVAIDATRVCITVKFVEEIAKPQLADLEFVFGLTPKEANVVGELFAGTRMQAIAEKMDISIHTVRVHTRHAYEKIGVSSREDLWRVLMPYSL